MSKTVWQRTAYGILKHMKGGMSHKGFTIVETLIVLAVTGALFVSAAILVNGRQRKTQFEQSIRQVHAQIQQTIDEINVGQYPSDPGFTCTASAGGPSLTSVASAEQGTNEGCIFLGKVIQFQIPGTDPEEFRAYTIAGLQKTGSGAEVTSLAEAKPKVVDPTAFPNSQTSESLQYGLTSSKMYYNNDAIGHSIGAVAIIGSLASYDNGTLQSASRQLDVLPIDGSSLGEPVSNMVSAINSKFSSASADSDLNPSDGVQICFVSAGTNQSGLITIGSNGRQLNTSLSIKEGTSC